MNIMYTDDHLRHLYKTHKNFNKGNKSLQVYIKKKTSEELKSKVY